MLQPDKALFCEEDEFTAARPDLPLSPEMRQKDALHTLGENAAAVLHELRGPLQAIRAHVQLLERKTNGNEELLRHFNPIYNGIEHINDLLNQFLRLTRLNPARLAPLNLYLCLQEILPLLRSVAVMRNIELTTELEESLPPCLGDEQQLKRLLFNLFTNACDAAGDTKNPLVQLILKREGAKIYLTVADNGCGISKGELKNIWLPFHTNKPGGTGLGLPSCLEIAAEHGGTITVSSKQGKGSRFTLQIPISK